MFNQRNITSVAANALFIFFLFGFFLTSNRGLVDDPGLGWHLRIADQMWESASFQYTEKFCYPSLEKPWVTYAWFGDIILRLSYEWGGLNALGVLTALNFAIVLWLLFVRMIREDVPWLLATLWTFMGAFAVLPSCTARPNMFTFVGLTLTVTICERFHRGAISKRQTLWLLPIFLVWVNSHSGFLSGALALTTTYAVEMLLSFFASGEIRKAAQARWIWWTKLGCALFLVTLLNPYGVNLYIYIFSTLGDPWIQRNTTTEWLPPDFKSQGWWRIELLVLLFPLLGVISRRKPSAVSLGLCLVFLHFALTGARYTGLWAVIAIPSLARLSCDIPLLQPLQLWLRHNTRDQFRAWFQNGEGKVSWIPGLTVAGLLFGLSGWLPAVSQHDPAHMPTQALQRLLDEYRGERIYHAQDWGGYLTWHGWNRTPRLKTWIDDRLEVHGREHQEEHQFIMNAEVGWEDRLQKHGVELICLPARARLVDFARLSPQWIEVYSDSQAVIFRYRPLPDQPT